MKPEQQNRVIAEWMGWTNIYCQNFYPSIHENSTVSGWFGKPPEGGSMAVPNFHGSLDAISEAVQHMVFSKRKQYRAELQVICSRGLEPGRLVDISECIDAAPSFRAEAIVRMLGKWEEE